jgi:hypothetical protein
VAQRSPGLRRKEDGLMSRCVPMLVLNEVGLYGWLVREYVTHVVRKKETAR